VISREGSNEEMHLVSFRTPRIGRRRRKLHAEARRAQTNGQVGDGNIALAWHQTAIVLSILWMGLGLFTFIGGINAMVLKHYAIAVAGAAASLLATLSYMAPVNVVVGVVALVVLLHKDVRTAFRS